MGKIFGISNNPVTTIESSLRVLDSVPKTPVRYVKRTFNPPIDLFVSKERQFKQNPVIRMRNGIGRLMRHFSKSKS